MSSKLLEHIERMKTQQALPEADYYHITLLGTEDNKVNRSISTSWVGFTETKPQREIRRATVVIPDKLRKVLTSINQSSVIVNNDTDLFIYMLIGGHGIIETTIAAKFFDDIINPREMAQSFSKGWKVVSDLLDHEDQHAPTKKLRASIIKRDEFKCKMCGRSPKNYVDIELHVHHILPWGQGGITEEDNLITLCSTCHEGLDPHYEMKLFELIDISWLQDAVVESDDYNKGVELYRKMSIEAYKEIRK
jgi:hypothetical protein